MIFLMYALPSGNRSCRRCRPASSPPDGLNSYEILPEASMPADGSPPLDGAAARIPLSDRRHRSRRAWSLPFNSPVVFMSRQRSPKPEHPVTYNICGIYLKIPGIVLCCFLLGGHVGLPCGRPVRGQFLVGGMVLRAQTSHLFEEERKCNGTSSVIQSPGRFYY